MEFCLSLMELIVGDYTAYSWKNLPTNKKRCIEGDLPSSTGIVGSATEARIWSSIIHSPVMYQVDLLAGGGAGWPEPLIVQKNRQVNPEMSCSSSL